MSIGDKAGEWLDAAALIPRTGPTRALAARLEKQDAARVRRFERFTPARFHGACAHLLDTPEANHPDIQPILARQPTALRRNRTAVLANPGLPLTLRIATAQQMGTHWRFRLAVSEAEVPHETIEDWIRVPAGPFRFPLSQMHDLLAVRPALLPVAVASGGWAAAGAAGSLHLSPEYAEALLAAVRESAPAGRGALRELAVNPQLPYEIRAEALARVTRHWPAARRAEARATLDGHQATPPGPAPDISRMSDGEAADLIAWASGTPSIALGQARDDARKPAVLSRLTSDARVSRWIDAGTIRIPDWSRWRSTGLPPRPDLPMQDLPEAARGWDDAGLVAAACTAGLRTSEWWLSRSVAAAAAHYVRARLGTDTAAWETFSVLRTEWSGNVEELLTASLTL